MTAHTRNQLRRSTVPAAVTGLLIASAALAPAASAAASASSGLKIPVVCESTAEDTVGSQNPGNPDAIDFEGTGTVVCLTLTGGLLAKGTSTFSGTIPKGACTNLDQGYVYRARVDWNDGTYTTGTFDDFTQTKLGGTAAVLISGVTDASSTKFGSWHNLLVSASLGGCGTPAAEADKTQAGVVLYTP
ncbi:hypothetical protein [Kineosporia succinea]|uniref:Secreted protein n=1 Tax=Kineosporia succinea TaxID=84632 RepID=A0ABT9P805_9ACTN|nr:hypothetical protein [Kineosporia succinea]MDP9828835.1 hypothetical protein [Kineosporia succinea]